MTICNEVDCKKQAFYNTEGEKPKYCGIHKTNIMVNVINPRCIHIGCNSISPSFNMEGQKQGLYCGTHKLDGMVDVMSKRCIHNGCNSIKPQFNVEGQKKGLYCKTHKTEGMVDVIHKRCIENGCNSLSHVFNVEGQKTGVYCGTHKLNGMVDVKNPRCKTHLCDTFAHSKQYRGYCIRCFIHTFPDEPVTHNYKTKERAVVESILKEFPNISWICDKTVPNGCSRRRPDLNGDMGTHVIMSEVDENQHTNYDTSCENKRTMELSQDVGHRPIVFIRFNPDGYTDTNGKKITSCWSVNGNGILVVKPSKIGEWNARINTLKLQIRYWIDNVPDKTIEVIQLFY